MHNAPTPKQLSTLRSLATSRGCTFVMPRTRWAASKAISELIAMPRARRVFHEAAPVAAYATELREDETVQADENILGVRIWA